jgi:hypothetical protein
VTECASENLSESSSCSQPLLKNELRRKDSERGREGASEGVSERASERRLGESSLERPEPECHKYEPSDRTILLLYQLRAWVHFAGRHVQPAQPSTTRRTTGWQACTTGTTGCISNKKKQILFFLLGISPVVPVVHACQPVVRLVLDGCAGCTCLPAKCT